MEAPARGLKKPEAVLHALDRAAKAVRKNELQIAVHHVGNALLMLKQALSPEPAKRKAKSKRMIAFHVLPRAGV
jgi:hypothetical protein